MSDQGLVTAVETRTIGSTLAADAAASDTVIYVDDNQPFVDGTTIVVTTIDGATATTTVAPRSTSDLEQDDPTVVRLAGGLGVDAAAGDAYLEVQPPQVVTTALVALDGPGEALPCTVPHGLQDALPTGLRDPGTEESVIVARDDTGELRVTDVIGKTTVRDLSNADPATIPEPQPTEPPAELLTIQATGDAQGLTAVASGDTLEPTTLLRWYIDDVVVETTRSEVVRFSRDSLGQPLALDVDYTIHVQPINVAGDGTLSPAVTARLDPEMSAETVLGIVKAGFVLAGAMSVGLMTWSPPTDNDPGGLRIPLLNGGLIHLPANGTDAIIDAIIRARQLVAENVRITGPSNYLEGGLVLASGITAPRTQPRIGRSWEHPGAKLTPDTGPIEDLDIHRGLYDAGTDWLFCASLYGGNVQAMSKSTGQRFLLKEFPGGAGTGFSPRGGITRVGSSWYVLGTDAARGSDFFVYVYDTSWNKTREFIVGAANRFDDMTISTDGTRIFIATIRREAAVAGEMWAYEWTTDGTFVRADRLDQAWPDQAVRGLYVGAADLGTARYAVAHANGVRIYTKNGGANGAAQSRVIANDWSTPPSAPIRGLAWDGTRFHSASSRGEVWAYARRPATETRTFTYSWFDADPAGLGVAETQPGPGRSYTAPPRTWVRVETDPPADGGGVDDPNSVRIYADDRRQSDPGPGVISTVYDVLDLTTPTGQTVNGFAARPGLLGELTSLARTGTRPSILMQGTGEHFLDPAKDLSDTGWVDGTLDTSAASSGWSGTGVTVAYCRARKKGGRYDLELRLARSAALDLSASSNYPNQTLGALAAEIRPSRTIEASARFNDAPVRVVIGTDGAVTVVGGVPAVFPANSIFILSAAGWA